MVLLRADAVDREEYPKMDEKKPGSDPGLFAETTLSASWPEAPAAPDWEVVTIKKAIIRASQKVLVHAISARLNSVQKIKVCPLSEVDILVTELNPDHAALDTCRAAGVEMM